MRTIRPVGCALAAATALALTAQPTAGQSASRPAALIVFPYVAVSAEVDTVVQLVNATGESIDVRCTYRDYMADCDGIGSCQLSPQQCNGTCIAPEITPFRVRLTPHQPLGWRASRGLAANPYPDSRGTRVPALLNGVFEGTLRCVVVDARGRPTDENALIGSVSTERATGTGEIDAAQYDAIGLPAIADANDGDEFLRLGGAHAEYAPCPASLALPTLFDFATLRTGVSAGTVSTTVALMPCGGSDLGERGTPAVFQTAVYNEFGQRLQTSLPFEGLLVTPLSRIDTAQPLRSIFSAAVMGTLTGQADFESINGGLLGVAIQSHSDLADPSRRHRAAVHLPREGALARGESLALLNPPCDCDCSGDGRVGVEELVLAINSSLSGLGVDNCAAADADGSGRITIAELIGGVANALGHCPALAALPSPDPEGTPRPTPIPVAEASPEIVYLGIASGDDVPQEPSGVDDEGRPIYDWPVGQGFTLVVEARQGLSRRPIGQTASSEDPDLLPDLQVIVSRPLGDGSPAVCDADLPTAGGVPAVDPLTFTASPDVAHAINDLGCRAEDSRGLPLARGSTPCTRIPPENAVAMARPRTLPTQFCIPIARAWAFPTGGTIVAARVRDVQGGLSPVQEMVVRVAAESP